MDQISQTCSDVPAIMSTRFCAERSPPTCRLSSRPSSTSLSTSPPPRYSASKYRRHWLPAPTRLSNNANLCRSAECPLLAQSGHIAAESQCPLLRVKRTSHGRDQTVLGRLKFYNWQCSFTALISRSRLGVAV